MSTALCRTGRPSASASLAEVDQAPRLPTSTTSTTGLCCDIGRRVLTSNSPLPGQCFARRIMERCEPRQGGADCQLPRRETRSVAVVDGGLSRSPGSRGGSLRVEPLGETVRRPFQGSGRGPISCASVGVAQLVWLPRADMAMRASRIAAMPLRYQPHCSAEL
jgi:hypothetical protein